MSGVGKALGGIVGGIFGGGDKPKVQSAPPAPSTDDAAKRKADEAAAAERARRIGGRGADILTSPLGDTSEASLAKKKLLGS